MTNEDNKRNIMTANIISDKSAMQATIKDNGMENGTLRIFTGIGIILIVAGHLQAPILDLGGIFPYYSFHVFIFLFVTGYFYNVQNENNILKYIVRKAKKLLIPYYIYNLIYGLISTYLNSRGVYVGGTLTFKSLFIDPFLGGHQFMFNSPAWFVPALFCVEVIYICSMKILHMILRALGIKNVEMLSDVLSQILFLGLGIITIYLAIKGHVWGYYKTPGSWLIMLPGVSFGRTYRTIVQPAIRKLCNRLVELLYSSVKNLLKLKRDYIYAIIKTLGILLLLVILILGQSVFTRNLGGTGFSVVWCTSFANGPVVPYITIISGMSFWYIIAVVINAAGSVKKGLLSVVAGPVGSVLKSVGKHSYTIMTNHFLVLFLVNSLCYGLNNRGLLKAAFDYELYRSDITYQCLYLGYHGTHIINLILCVGLPLIFVIAVTKLLTVFIKHAKQ